MTEPPRWGPLALGVFLTLLGTYVLTGAGRIDFIDGQYRYEVARNWLDHGEPVLLDTALGFSSPPVNPRTGKVYAVYNAGPSAVAMPLMLASRLLPGHHPERDRFAFSLAGALLGAAVGPLLLAGYRLLGLDGGAATAGALVFGLCTQWWPGSVTVFDQNQHGVILLASVLLAWQSGRHTSMGLAAAGGLVGGLLFTWQESYGLLLPLVALAVFTSPSEGAPMETTPREARWSDAIPRYLTFGACTTLGLGLFFAYNRWRLDEWLVPARYFHPWPHSPLAGVASLVLSPGKSIFLFSPPLVLAVLGAGGLWRQARWLAIATGSVAVAYLLLISNLAFFGGEWSWGPRYLLVVLPLLALALPLGLARSERRWLAGGLVAMGLAVQLMGVSLDHQRFFFERNLPPHFWATDRWVYFKDSQLLARPLEIAAMLGEGMPREAAFFSPTPRGEMTSAPFGPAVPETGARWVRFFQVFHLPRPWPLWMARIEPDRRPVPLGMTTIVSASLAIIGATILTGAWARGRFSS